MRLYAKCLVRVIAHICDPTTAFHRIGALRNCDIFVALFRNEEQGKRTLPFIRTRVAGGLTKARRPCQKPIPISFESLRAIPILNLFGFPTDSKF